MARIQLQVEVNDLENSDLDGFAEKFEIWLRQAYKAVDAPDGHIDEAIELDRTEDEDAEED